MAKERPKTTVKQFTKIISDSSQKLLAAFLNDDIKLKKQTESLRKEINLACSQKSFVVLQIAEPTNPAQSFETVTGKLRLNKQNPDLIVLSDQQTKKIRMIPINQIRKVSFLKPKITKKQKRKIT